MINSPENTLKNSENLKKTMTIFEKIEKTLRNKAVTIQKYTPINSNTQNKSEKSLDELQYDLSNSLQKLTQAEKESIKAAVIKTLNYPLHNENQNSTTELEHILKQVS